MSVCLIVDDLDIKYSRSSGPGGQHVNKSRNRLFTADFVVATIATNTGKSTEIVVNICCNLQGLTRPLSEILGQILKTVCVKL